MRIVIADPNLMSQRSTFEAALPDGATASWHDSWNEHSVLTDLKDADVYVGPTFTEAMGAVRRNYGSFTWQGQATTASRPPHCRPELSARTRSTTKAPLPNTSPPFLVALRRNLIGQDAALRTGSGLPPSTPPRSASRKHSRGAVVTFLGFGHIGSAAWNLLQAFGAEGIAITRSGTWIRRRIRSAGPAQPSGSPRRSVNRTSWSSASH